jgi:hypothetical protein
LVTTPPTLPTHPQRPSRLRSFCIFVVAMIYVFVAEVIAHRAASGLSSGDWMPLVDRLVMLFLLLWVSAHWASAFRGSGNHDVRWGW